MTPSYEAPGAQKEEKHGKISGRGPLSQRKSRGSSGKNDTEGKGRPAEPAALRFPYL